MPHSSAQLAGCLLLGFTLRFGFQPFSGQLKESGEESAGKHVSTGKG
jgi:hypothetical protein